MGCPLGVSPAHSTLEYIVNATETSGRPADSAMSKQMLTACLCIVVAQHSWLVPEFTTTQARPVGSSI